MLRSLIDLRRYKRWLFMLAWVFPALALVRCQHTALLEPEVENVVTNEATEIQTSTPLSPLGIEAAATEEEVQETPSVTPIPSPTNTPTETPLPDGFAIVPDLRGLPLSEARIVVSDAGFSFLFQDVLDPDVPSGTIIDQDPPAGTALPRNEIVFLYRSFQALQMYAGGACQPLKITLPSGKLLYWVNLEEGIRYTVKTDFSQGRTQISDYRMYLMAEFDNATRDSIDFTPLAPGRYVISLGPYEVAKSKLGSDGVISAGCLWITPEDLE
jgi:hypothetical protein